MTQILTKESQPRLLLRFCAAPAPRFCKKNPNNINKRIEVEQSTSLFQGHGEHGITQWVFYLSLSVTSAKTDLKPLIKEPVTVRVHIWVRCTGLCLKKNASYFLLSLNAAPELMDTNVPSLENTVYLTYQYCVPYKHHLTCLTVQIWAGHLQEPTTKAMGLKVLVPEHTQTMLHKPTVH